MSEEQNKTNDTAPLAPPQQPQPYYPPPQPSDTQPPCPAQYVQQPPYPEQSRPPKKKIWPWVLGGCLLVVVLGIAGCVGCISCIVVSVGAASSSDIAMDTYDYLNDYSDDGEDSSDSSGGYTLEEIREATGITNSDSQDGIYPEGVYVAGVDIEPGLYYLGGNINVESSFYLFSEDDGYYNLQTSFAYFGNYFVDLEEGDLLVYFPNNAEQYMQLASNVTFTSEAPYSSGVYRVCSDIPAGTYTVTVDDDALNQASQDSAAFVMADLEFNDDTFVDAQYVIAGGSQSVTVTDGDYLELYAATAIPAE